MHCIPRLVFARRRQPLNLRGGIIVNAEPAQGTLSLSLSRRFGRRRIDLHGGGHAGHETYARRNMVKRNANRMRCASRTQVKIGLTLANPD